MTARLIAATDGSASPNPGPTGWAWVVADATGTVRRVQSGFIAHATNNIGELTAIAELLHATDPRVPLEIRVDSEYAMNVATGRYKATKNRHLVEPIKQLLAGRPTTTFTWVPAHQPGGDPLNAIADHAARDAVTNRRGSTRNAPDR